MAKVESEFFPKGIFGERSHSDEFIRKWYSEQLSALEEVSLYPAASGIEVYRFTWLRTFHNPMAFKVTVLESGAGALTVKRANGAGGFKPGVVDLRKEISLSNLQVAGLKKGLVNMSYWEKPVRLETMGTDGAEWIIEASVNGTYKIVDRWSKSDSAVQAWGMELINLSRLDVGKVY
jgi:hypothetical protein